MPRFAGTPVDGEERKPRWGRAGNPAPKHPEFDGSNIPGYDPKTGMVERQHSKAGSAFMGAADTMSFGVADEGAAALNAALGRDTYENSLAQIRGTQKAAQEQNPGSYLAGQIGGGVGLAAATGGASLGGGLVGTGGGLARAAGASAIDGAIYGGLYGAGSGEGLKDRIGGAATGVAMGGGLGLAAPLAVAGVTNGVRRAVSPFTIAPERQAAISVLEREGVPLTAGQRTGSDALRYAEGEIGGRGAARIADDQGAAFTDAIMRRAGASGLATSDNLASNSSRLSKGFEDIAARNALQADPQLGQAIGRTLNRYGRLLESQQKPIVDGLADDIITRLQAGGGKMSGADYQMIRSDLSKAVKSASNENLAGAFRGLRDALDGAMDRSVSPADAGAWKELRRQWGNKKVIENAIAGAGGEDAAMGVISPARLRMAASTGNRGGYARGEGDFSELAKAGQAVMTPMPNSGTASRLAVRGLLSAPAAAGAVVGGTTGDVMTGLLGAAAGAAVPRAVGSAMMSKAGQKFLSNQLLAGGTDPLVRDRIARMILGGAVPQIGR